MSQLNQVANEFLQEFGREPTTEEMADRAGVNLEEAQQVLSIARQPTSLNRPIGETDENDIGDFVEDGTARGPADSAAREMLRDNIHVVLKTLTYREREIIKLRYGLGDGYPYTLEQVGRIFRVTRERVRQIEAKAFDKLQDPRRSCRLEGFLDGIPRPVATQQPAIVGA